MDGQMDGWNGTLVIAFQITRIDELGELCEVWCLFSGSVGCYEYLWWKHRSLRQRLDDRPFRLLDSYLMAVLHHNSMATAMTVMLLATEKSVALARWCFECCFIPYTAPPHSMLDITRWPLAVVVVVVVARFVGLWELL
jgi:hypothetical protein